MNRFIRKGRLGGFSSCRRISQTVNLVGGKAAACAERGGRGRRGGGRGHGHATPFPHGTAPRQPPRPPPALAEPHSAALPSPAAPLGAAGAHHEGRGRLTGRLQPTRQGRAGGSPPRPLSPTVRGPRVLPEAPPRTPGPQRSRHAQQPRGRHCGTPRPDRRHLTHAPSRPDDGDDARAPLASRGSLGNGVSLRLSGLWEWRRGGERRPGAVTPPQWERIAVPRAFSPREKARNRSHCVCVVKTLLRRRGGPG